MPVVDSIIVTVFPDDGHGIGTHGDHIGDPRGGRIAKMNIEHIRIWLRLHILMSAAAGCTWTGSAQQLKRINAGVTIAPRDGEFFCLFVGSNAGWFFVHFNSFPLPYMGEGRGEVRCYGVAEGAGTYVRKSDAAQPVQVSS